MSNSKEVKLTSRNTNESGQQLQSVWPKRKIHDGTVTHVVLPLWPKRKQKSFKHTIKVRHNCNRLKANLNRLELTFLRQTEKVPFAVG